MSPVFVTTFVLTKLNPGQVPIYWTGKFAEGRLSERMALTGGIGKAKTFKRRIDAADAWDSDDLLHAFDVTEQTLWFPQPDEQVVYTARSKISGAAANRRLATVRKLTPAGYLHLQKVSDPLHRAGFDVFINDGMNFRTTVEPASARDIENLPAFHEMKRAQALGRELTHAEHQAREKAKANG